MRFIFTEKYFGKRDNRPHNICVSSDKLGFFCLYAIFSFFESYALFSDKNENIQNKLSHLNSPSGKNNSCMQCMPMFFLNLQNNNLLLPLNFSGCGVIRWVFGGVDSTLFTAFLLIQNNQTDRAVSRTSQG